MHLIWLRTDLRLHDNTALAAASQRGPLAAVYLITPQQWLDHDDAPCKVDFWLRNLQDLSKTLGALNSLKPKIQACSSPSLSTKF